MPQEQAAGALRDAPAPGRYAAHRLIAFWLLATTPVLLLPGDGLPLRLTLAPFHLLAATLLLGIPPETAPDARRGVGRALLDWLPLLLAPAFYWEVPLLATAILGTGAHFDAVVQAWEVAAFGGQPSRTLGSRFPWLWLSEPLHAAYLSFYFFILVPPVVLGIRRLREGVRTVIFTIVLVAIAHAAVFASFPVLGPRYLFPAPTGPLESGPLYRLTHWVLDRGSSPGTAFPSSHVGLAVAVTIALARLTPRAAPWVGLLAAALAVSTIYGGFHYAVDVLAGAALGGTLALTAPSIRRRLGRAAPRTAAAGAVYEAPESATTSIRRNA